MTLPPTLKLRRDLLRIAVAPGLSPAVLGEVVNRHGGINYHDVRGYETPFDLLGKLGLSQAVPSLDFLSRVAAPETFTPPSLPVYYNSEPSVSRFLAQLICLRKPRVVVELGCFVGWASVHMALALESQSPAGRLICVDIFEPALTATGANLLRHQVKDRCTLLLGGSLDSAVVAQMPPQLDLVFLDSSHSYPETLKEMRAYLPRLSSTGCMVLHDSISFSGVRRSLAEIGDEVYLHTFATEQGNGLTVLAKK